MPPPETNFSRINSRTLIDRAEVNLPPLDPAALVRIERNDPVSYPPLIAPGALPHGISPPAAPVPDKSCRVAPARCG